MYDDWAPDPALDALDARTAVTVSELEQRPAGASLVAGLVALRGVSMDCTSAVRVTALWDRVIAFAHAESMISCAEAVRAGDLPACLSKGDAIQIVAQDLATMTQVTFGVAMDRVAFAGQVGRQLPLSWEALDRGELTLAHLKALAAQTSVCPPRIAQLVDARVIPMAIDKHWTPSQLGNAAARAIIAIDPEGAADRAGAAKACADVTLYPENHETASMVATGDAVPLRMVMDAIDARAAELRRFGDLRPIGLRRFDALAGYVLGAEQVTRPTVEAVVTIDLTTLLGLTQRPGELSGYGPISPETARELTQHATLRRLITDPMTGRALDLGRTRYRPSEPLRRFIEVRDRTCRFPGCARRATHCDVDHAQDFAPGGHTDACNPHSLCRMHHNLKTKKLWHVDINPDGSEVWTSPLGFIYRRPAATYPIELLEPPDDVDAVDLDMFELRQSDSDPPIDDDSELPEPPPITDEEYRSFTDALDQRCYLVANENYDQWHALGLVS